MKEWKDVASWENMSRVVASYKMESPVAVFQGDSDYEIVKGKIDETADWWDTDHYTYAVYKINGTTIIKTPLYTTLDNRMYILEESLLSQWLMDDMFGGWANESFVSFISESRSSVFKWVP
jgi:hypothetical protein